MGGDTGMITRKTVGIGSVYAASGSAELVSYAIGSCIALCLYDPGSGVGAMAHILLPSGSYTGYANNSIGMRTKYADCALLAALEKMRELGANPARVQAAMIGGARMFPHGDVRMMNIGEMNVSSVSMELEKSGIPLLFSQTGGEKSRTVTFRIPGVSFDEQIRIKSPQLSM